MGFVAAKHPLSDTKFSVLTYGSDSQIDVQTWIHNDGVSYGKSCFEVSRGSA